MTLVGPKLTLRARRCFCEGTRGLVSKSAPPAVGRWWVVSTLRFLAGARCLPVLVDLESDRLSQGACEIVATSGGMPSDDGAIVDIDGVDNDVPR
mmetsp:Transcript_104024/g.270825  ORF Transcript_104024/g.270825 Transcript_104024/m.270825 type:complete len:95 (-) Transcript_104024:289-573(-)